ncbi:hypothetical protein RJ640_001905 [Escallonia rubra]|uniref:Zinc knuckle CX2CX4HX4C domain-containing protein n=1 Tax=Escallonia rubra TaxID=112253 RepID=A0AA88RQK9_9ASTE|nr:hypothetical protein RJ640_001905 [Escallonia rubra]
MASPSYGHTNTEERDSINRRGWLIPSSPTRVLDARERWARTLVGRFVDFQKFSTRRVAREVQDCWEGGGFIRIERVKNLYLFHFEKEATRDLYLAGNTWNLCGALLIFTALQPNTPLHDHRFDVAPVWIQLKRLPFEYFNAEDAAIIGRAAGQVLAVDWSPEGRKQYDFIRVQVQINPFKPLVPGAFIELLDTHQPRWIPFSYEKLFRVCFRCGVIGHSNYMCSKSLDEVRISVDQAYAHSGLARQWDLLMQTNRQLYDEQILAWPNTNFNRSSKVKIIEDGDGTALHFEVHERRRSLESVQSLEELQSLHISFHSSDESSTVRTPHGALSHGSPTPPTGMEDGDRASLHSPINEAAGRQPAAAESAMARVGTWLQQEIAITLPGCMPRAGQVAAAVESPLGGVRRASDNLGGELLDDLGNESQPHAGENLSPDLVGSAGRSGVGCGPSLGPMGNRPARGPVELEAERAREAAGPADRASPNNASRPWPTEGPSSTELPGGPSALGTASEMHGQAVGFGFHMVAPSFPPSSLQSGQHGATSEEESDPSEDLGGSSQTAYLSVVSTRVRCRTRIVLTHLEPLLPVPGNGRAHMIQKMITLINGNGRQRDINLCRQYIRSLKFVLKSWHFSTCNLASRIHNLQKRISEGQLNVVTSVEQRRDRALREELDHLLACEEQYWAQRSGERWLLLGDRNTRFFHSMCHIRKQQNFIATLSTSDGAWTRDEQQIRDLFQDYFSNLFSASVAGVPCRASPSFSILRHLRARLSPDQLLQTYMAVVDRALAIENDLEEQKNVDTEPFRAPSYGGQGNRNSGNVNPGGRGRGNTWQGNFQRALQGRNHNFYGNGQGRGRVKLALQHHPQVTIIKGEIRLRYQARNHQSRQELESDLKCRNHQRSTVAPDARPVEETQAGFATHAVKLAPHITFFYCKFKVRGQLRAPVKQEFDDISCSDK